MAGLWLLVVGTRLTGQSAPPGAPANLVEAVQQDSSIPTTAEPPLAALEAALRRFGISIDSQLLVFSKTSLQVDRISASAPRAIFFADDITVGYVQGGDMEVAVFDPKDGLALYTRAMSGTDRRFERHSFECASCHGVTRLLLQSVTPARDGMPLLAFTGSELPVAVDYRTPFEQRWGGWYVTGLHGALRHRGNAVAPDPLRPYDLDLSHNSNTTSLPDIVDRSRYLTPTSDIVALMTYEHQVITANALARLNVLARRAPVSSPDVIGAIDTLVGYLLFAGEAPLVSPVSGVSTFTTTFTARGPFDKSGRSLRQFDLTTRLFRYRLSYMIYSAAFDALPQDFREAVYGRLFTALTTPTAGLAVWPEAERRAVLEIVRDTKTDLPEPWAHLSLDRDR